MIRIPLTEITSGKKYTLLIPVFTGPNRDSIGNSLIQMKDSIDAKSMNIPLQLDMYDDQPDFTGEEITVFETNSGKKLDIRRIGTATQLEFIIRVYINGTPYSTVSQNAYETYGLWSGIRIDKTTWNASCGLSLLYNETNKNFYKFYGMSSVTTIEKVTFPDGTENIGFRLTADKQISPPFSKFYNYNVKQCLFNEDSTNQYYATSNINFKNWFNSLEPNDWSNPYYPEDPDDPENPEDNPTDPSPGAQDGTSDPIGIPTKPIIDVTGTGFVTLYNPSAIDIRQLAYFMWSGEFVDIIKKMFSAPFDCLIGLKLIYAPITTGASQTIWLGNVESTVSAPKITDQFTDFDCGSITIDGYFGSFLDYAPYTKVTIFLPFIGYKQLNVDEVMNSTIHLVYRVDAYSGACIAFLHVTKTIGSTQLSSVLYEFDGNCAMDIPFTSGDMSRYVAAILGTAASTAGAVVSMGAGAKLSTQAVPITNNDPWTKNDFSNKQTVTGLSDLGNGSAELIGGKPQIQRGGSLAGANASMALKQPYIIIERPMQQMPADYANFIGIPLNMTKTLSQMSGFTVVSQIFMASSQATDDELDMIDSLLRQGVII